MDSVTHPDPPETEAPGTRHWKVRVEETVERIVPIDADTYEEALRKAEDACAAGLNDGYIIDFIEADAIEAEEQTPSPHE